MHVASIVTAIIGFLVLVFLADPTEVDPRWTIIMTLVGVAMLMGSVAFWFL